MASAPAVTDISSLLSRGKQMVSDTVSRLGSNPSTPTAPEAAAEIAAKSPAKPAAPTGSGIPLVKTNPQAHEAFADSFWRAGGSYTKSPEYQEQVTKGLNDKQLAQYLRQQFEEGVPAQLNNLDEAKQALARSFRHASTQTPGAMDAAEARLAAYPQQLEDLYEEAGYTPEQRKAFMESAAQEGMTPGAFNTPWIRSALQQKITSAIDKEEADFDQTMKAVQATDMNISDFGNFLTSNWSNLITPIGVILGLFGGNNFTKILGIMGAGLGSYDLYNRYKVMADPANPANSFFNSALKQATVENGKAKAKPFDNLPEIQQSLYSQAVERGNDPKQAQELAQQAIQGVQDFQLLSKIGFGNAISGRGHDMAASARRVYDFSPSQPQGAQ